MSSKNVGIIRGHCRDCGWDYERSLEAGDGLTVEQNQEIAQRVIRNHRFRCGEEWAEAATVDRDLEMVGGQNAQ